MEKNRGFGIPKSGNIGRKRPVASDYEIEG